MIQCMRIVIVGLGQTGQEIAKEFIDGGHEITVVDTCQELVEEFTNHYDAIGVVGSGASKEVQLKAKANVADVLIALSPTDEVNLMSCITAKLLGTKYTIARVTASEYTKDEDYLTKELGIDLVINAEYETAKQITRIVGYPSNVKTGAFANGKVDVIELKIKEEKFGKINGATINHSADINCPYEGIFFYLPHAVEMMLELFGYDPVSVNTTVLASNNFTVCVKYSDKLINLVISSCRPTYVVINGEQSEAKEIESSDIFRDEMKAFVKAIEENKPCKDVSKLTEHVSVILAVNESIKTKGEVPIEKFRL